MYAYILFIFSLWNIMLIIVIDVAVEVLSSVTPTKEKSLGTSYAMAVSR